MNIETRTLEEAKYILQTGQTIRETAKTFGLSKSTVHKDLQDRLSGLDKTLYEQVNNIFIEHIKIRHIRGGEATKFKYLRKE